ncbi:MAG: hypothetical protein KC925_01020 [Candidatus Doudnabacteria bacterium]|nr:hypothetical protein [Candidatus Doudnabacteria bacterium]
MSTKWRGGPIRFGVIGFPALRECRLFLLLRDPESAHSSSEAPPRYEKAYGLLKYGALQFDFRARDLHDVRREIAAWQALLQRDGYPTVPGFIWLTGLLERTTSPFPEPVVKPVHVVEVAASTRVGERRSLALLKQAHLQLVSSLADLRNRRREPWRHSARFRSHMFRCSVVGSRRRRTQRNC